MKKYLSCLYWASALAFAISLVSCSGSIAYDAVVADVEQAQCVDISEIGREMRLVPISGDSILGAVTYAKVAGGKCFFYDEARRSIHIVEEDGTCQEFNKVGRGPEEYIDLWGFSYVESENELVIFERRTKSLRFYSLEDYSESKALKMDCYLNALEHLEGSEFLLLKEGADNLPPALVRYDTENGEGKVLMELRQDQANMAEDYFFSKRGDDILFGVSGLNTEIYRYRDSLQKIAVVSFVPNKLGRSYWNGEFTEKKERDLMRILQDGGPGIALSPMDVSVADAGSLSFWYFVARGAVSHELPHRQCCVLRDGVATLYSQISCNDLGIKSLQPVASDGHRTYSLLAGEEITPLPGSALGDSFLEMKNNGYNNYILSYELY